MSFFFVAFFRQPQRQKISHKRIFLLSAVLSVVWPPIMARAAEHEMSLSFSSGARAFIQRSSVAPLFLRGDMGWGARDWLVLTLSGGVTGEVQVLYERHLSRYGKLNSDTEATAWLYEALAGFQIQWGTKTTWSSGLEVGPQIGTFRPNRERLSSGMTLALPGKPPRTGLALLGRWKVLGVERRFGEHFSAGAWAALDAPIWISSSHRKNITGSVSAQVTFYFFPSD